MKRNELIDYVKRQLGYPTVNVELTDEQINDCISNALREIKNYYSVFKYLTIDVNTSCIDLSEYGIAEVTDVMKVFDASSSRNGSSSGIDPFSYNGSGMQAYYSIPYYSISKYSTALTTNQNIHRVISSYASMYQEQFYANLARIMQDRLNGSLYENISWKFYDNKLYIDTGVPYTSVVTIEYIPDVLDTDDVDEHSVYLNHLKDLSVAFSLLIQARVTGKYQVSGSPTTINYADMRSDALRDIDRVREIMKKDTVNKFYITD